MATTFNELLEQSGISSNDVAILRHHTPARGVTVASIADLWRHDPPGFTLYQDTQKANRPIFRKRRIWASFVCPTPGETLFIGLFDAKLSRTGVADWLCPYRGDQPGGGKPVDRFTTSLRPELAEQIGKLQVDWPAANVRNWKRKAEGLILPLALKTLASSSGELIHDAALVAALEALGFDRRRTTSKIVQLRRGDLIVYVKRNTVTRPMVIHPGFLDVADTLMAIGGVDIALPPRTYVNSHLREFPEYVAQHRKTTGRHGFALGVTDASLAALITRLEESSCIETDEGAIRVVAPADDPLTEKERLQAARIGQGDFRNALIAAWSGACPLAGVDHLPILRASHIKPWKTSTNAERLDPFNGLLLCAHVDALFDRGLISFEDDGKVLISSALTATNLNRLGIDRTATISGLEPRHAPYLAYHRAHCFVP
ncbi:MAG TPA: HNH endonuclease [Sphingomicrobium sp.]|nr:HNH endonuclease [Sphingomicrobium sp.]